MTPIISPWIFYWIDVCDKLNKFAVSASGAIITVGFIAVAWYFLDDEHDGTWKRNRMRKLAKPVLAFAVICGLIVGFVPTKETSMMMLAASVVTPDNIAAAQGNIIDFISKVADAMAKTKEMTP